MNRLRPKNKICFQNRKNIHINLKLTNLHKKKWNLFKKRLRYKEAQKPEKRKKFYQQRLFEKQLFKNFYGNISEYKLKNIFNKLNKKNLKINIFKNMVFILESRLDINVLRLNFATSIYEAKQFISHKKVKVNTKIINKSNYILKKGDIITLI